MATQRLPGQLVVYKITLSLFTVNFTLCSEIMCIFMFRYYPFN